MNRDGHDSTTSYFIGPEVEHTPAYSKRTLFVIGKQRLDQIERMAREYKTPHIFMGANHSFTSESQDPYWDHVITALLNRGFWVTLDYQAHEHETVLTMLNAGIWASRQFVPLLGVRIPHVQTSSINLTVKIDDVDFAATNAGVWCMHHREVTDSNRFTDWQDYTTDEVLAPLSGEVPNPVLRVPVAPVSAPVAAPVADTNVEAQTETLNDSSIGLDPDSTSMLKAEEPTELPVQPVAIEQPEAPVQEPVAEQPAAPVEEPAQPADETTAETTAETKPAKKTGKK